MDHPKKGSRGRDGGREHPLPGLSADPRARCSCGSRAAPSPSRGADGALRLSPGPFICGSCLERLSAPHFRCLPIPVPAAPGWHRGHLTCHPDPTVTKTGGKVSSTPLMSCWGSAQGTTTIAARVPPLTPLGSWLWSAQPSWVPINQGNYTPTSLHAK